MFSVDLVAYILMQHRLKDFTGTKTAQFSRLVIRQSTRIKQMNAKLHSSKCPSVQRKYAV